MESLSLPISRNQSLNHNNSVILVSNSDPNSRFFLAVLSKRKTDFVIFSKSNLPSKKTRGELSRNAICVYVCVCVCVCIYIYMCVCVCVHICVWVLVWHIYFNLFNLVNIFLIQSAALSASVIITLSFAVSIHTHFFRLLLIYNLISFCCLLLLSISNPPSTLSMALTVSSLPHMLDLYYYWSASPCPFGLSGEFFYDAIYQVTLLPSQSWKYCHVPDSA